MGPAGPEPTALTIEFPPSREPLRATDRSSSGLDEFPYKLWRCEGSRSEPSTSAMLYSYPIIAGSYFRIPSNRGIDSSQSRSRPTIHLRTFLKATLAKDVGKAEFYLPHPVGAQSAQSRNATRPRTCIGATRSAPFRFTRQNMSSTTLLGGG